MSQVHLLYINQKMRLNETEQELSQVEKELEILGRERHSITVKRISGNLYYYEQWRENGRLKWKSLGRVSPGGIAEKEKEILRRNQLLDKEEDLQCLKKHLQAELYRLKDYARSERVLRDYSFEVFWKDTLSARVSVRRNRVYVTRLIRHPVRQLFSADQISRNQLNSVLRMRCFDENRADAKEKLRTLGLQSYNPLEIVKKTHGVSYNDFLWIRFPGEELTAKDVLVRGMYV